MRSLRQALPVQRRGSSTTAIALVLMVVSFGALGAGMTIASAVQDALQDAATEMDVPNGLDQELPALGQGYRAPSGSMGGNITR